MRYREHITGAEVRKCIEFYNSKANPIYIQLEEGVCGYGTFIMTADDDSKWMIVQEYYVNEWTSHHRIAFCNKNP